jgi:hypothetical protein
MEKSTQIKTKEGMVTAILEANPAARDDDRELIASYWRRQQPNLFNFRSGEAVLRALVNRELATPDDITRARRKVQAQRPDLRGRAWYGRHAEREPEVRQNINKPLEATNIGGLTAGELFPRQ